MPSGGRTSRWSLRTVAVGYVCVLVLLPLVMVCGRAFGQGGEVFWAAISSPDSISAFELTAEITVLAVLANVIFGVGVSLLLVRYRFPGHRLLNLIIDLPVSVSPVVAGLALVLVYSSESGWFGPVLAGAGMQVIFAVPGMVLATSFVSLPLIVRELVPVLQEEGLDQETAARSLGANAWQRFTRITVPTLKWALCYGVVLSAARSIGEFGAVRVVSGDTIGVTQTGTLRVADLAEQQEPGAYQVALVMVAFAVLCILVISLLRPKEAVR